MFIELFHVLLSLWPPGLPVNAGDKVQSVTNTLLHHFATRLGQPSLFIPKYNKVLHYLCSNSVYLVN